MSLEKVGVSLEWAELCTCVGINVFIHYIIIMANLPFYYFILIEITFFESELMWQDVLGIGC